MIVQHYYFSIARIAKQYSIHTANSIWCTAQCAVRMLYRNLQERRNNNKSNPRAKSILCFPRWWVCACLCGPPLRCATPPPRSKGTCLARVVVTSKLLISVHCNSTRAPSCVYTRKLVLNRSLARSNLSQVQGRELTHGRTHSKKLILKGLQGNPARTIVRASPALPIV